MKLLSVIFSRMQIICWSFLYHEVLQTTSSLLKMVVLVVMLAVELLRAKLLIPDTTCNKVNIHATRQNPAFTFIRHKLLL
jgi:hypothetical protein